MSRVNYSSHILMVLISLSFFIYGFNSGFNSAHDQIELIEFESDYLFLCADFNDGRHYSQEPCEDFFINITGNYCNGEIVCQNTLKEVRE